MRNLLRVDHVVRTQDAVGTNGVSIRHLSEKNWRRILINEEFYHRPDISNDWLKLRSSAQTDPGRSWLLSDGKVCFCSQNVPSVFQRWGGGGGWFGGRRGSTCGVWSMDLFTASFDEAAAAESDQLNSKCTVGMIGLSLQYLSLWCNLQTPSHPQPPDYTPP